MAGPGVYDVVIVGGGPAGLTAGIYTSRARLRTLLLEKALVGGQIANAEVVENFPGFPDGISGLELIDRMQRQAVKYGLETVNAGATGVTIEGRDKLVKTTDGGYRARAVIIASGSDRQKLGVPGEERLTGHGVSYCATCDGALFRDQPVAVVGGGNAAVNEALELAKFATSVVLIHRRAELRATPVLQERLRAEPKVSFLWNKAIEEIAGNSAVQELKLTDVTTGQKSSLAVAGLFVAIGLKPSTDYLKGVVTLDAAGYVIVNEKLETDVPGIFAAGDIRTNSGRQAIIAAGDGAGAAVFAERYLRENR